MRTVLTAAAALGLLCAAPAMAQTTPAAPSNTNSATAVTNAPTAPGALQRDVTSDLQKAGFTDIKVMPSSFLVRAKDKEGRPVMMVINPDSFTEITSIGQTPGTTGNTAKN